MKEPLAESGLLLVTPTFHPEQVGTPHYVTDLVLEGRQQGVPIRVVTNQPYYPGFRRFEGYGRERRVDKLNDIPIYRLPTVVPKGGGRFWRIASEMNMVVQGLFALALRRVPRAERVVAVSPGAPAAIFLGALMRRRGGVLTVVVHDIGFGLARAAGGVAGRSIAGWLQRLEVAALNRADDVTVLSDAMGRSLRAAGVTTSIRTVELWPTIEPGDYGATPDTPTVVYSGNLGRKQGLDRLLDLARALKELAPDARLVIRGDGSERKRLEQHARQRQLYHVDFLDLVPTDCLPDALARAHVHVIPQAPEGAEFAMPSKIVNVLAVGRPAIVTGAEDSPLGDLARECPAVIRVDANDIQGFASAVATILEMDPDRYTELSAAALHWALSRGKSSAIRRTLAGTDVLE